MWFFVYLIGLVLAFILNTLRLYKSFKTEYYCSPTLKGVLRVLDKRDLLTGYCFGLILYPFTAPCLLMWLLAKKIGKKIETLTNKLLKRQSDHSIIETKLAALKCGDRVDYIIDINKSSSTYTASVYNKEKNSITLKAGTGRVYVLDKDDIILYNNELLFDVSSQY